MKKNPVDEAFDHLPDSPFVCATLRDQADQVLSNGKLYLGSHPNRVLFEITQHPIHQTLKNIEDGLKPLFLCWENNKVKVCEFSYCSDPSHVHITINKS